MPDNKSRKAPKKADDGDKDKDRKTSGYKGPRGAEPLAAAVAAGVGVIAGVALAVGGGLILARLADTTTSTGAVAGGARDLLLFSFLLALAGAAGALSGLVFASTHRSAAERRARNSSSPRASLKRARDRGADGWAAAYLTGGGLLAGLLGVTLAGVLAGWVLGNFILWGVVIFLGSLWALLAAAAARYAVFHTTGG